MVGTGAFVEATCVGATEWKQPTDSNNALASD